MLRRLANSDHANLILACRLQAQGPHSEGFQIIDVQNAGEDDGSNQGHISDASASQAGPDETETVPVLRTGSAPSLPKVQQISTSTPAPGGNLTNIVLSGPRSRETLEEIQTTTTERQQQKGIKEVVTEEAEDQYEERETAIAKSLSIALLDATPKRQLQRRVPGSGRKHRAVLPQRFGFGSIQAGRTRRTSLPQSDLTNMRTQGPKKQNL